MLRSLAKSGAACALSWTDGVKIVSAVNGARPTPVVLGYHRVVDRFPERAGQTIPAMCVTRKMLERHLDWVGRRYRFVSADELGARLEWGSRFKDPVALVTFDDGYADVYELAFPLLKRKGIPAAVFVCTDLLGTEGLLIHDALYLLLARAFRKWRSPLRSLAVLLLDQQVWPEGVGGGMEGVPADPFAVMQLLLGRVPRHDLDRVITALREVARIERPVAQDHRVMTWDMVRKMREAGITIGSHTATHAVLPNEEPRRAADELCRSRRVLDETLGARTKHFAYPCGRFDAAVVHAAANAGYRFAFTTCLHREPRYPLLTIPRKFLWEKSCLGAWGRFSSAVMRCQVYWAFERFSGCPDPHAPRVTPVPRVAAGSTTARAA